MIRRDIKTEERIKQTMNKRKIGQPTKLTEAVKKQILFYSLVLNLSTRAIGKELNLNHNTVASFLREYKAKAAT